MLSNLWEWQVVVGGAGLTVLFSRHSNPNGQARQALIPPF
jgi:hypothetical protein